MAYITNEDLGLGGYLIGTDEADTIVATFPGAPFVTTWLVGGGGNDTYVVDDEFYDLIVEEAGGGNDTVRSNTTYTLAAFVENLVLVDDANTVTDDTADAIGNDLANSLTGNSGNNYLDGKGGNDTMAGGLGDDGYAVDSALDVVTEAANGGIDYVDAYVNYTLGANVENLYLTLGTATTGTGNAIANQITGNTLGNTLRGLAGNDTLSGEDGDDILDGGDGNDVLIGGLGSDSYTGGAGDDLFYVDASDKPVVEAANGGNDSVYSFANHTLANNVENLTLAIDTPAALNGTGNALNNWIRGNQYANVLTGLAGNDTLDGQGGADTMAGGAGNDIYYVDNFGDKVVELAGEGTDKVVTSVFITLPDYVENLLIVGGNDVTAYGNALNNTMTGDDSRNFLLGFGGNDILDGKGGADNLQGGLGDDIYYFDNVGDYAQEMKDQGTDTVFTSVGYNFFGLFYIENMTLTGTADGDIIGNSQNNIINGNAGSNLIDGRGGIDTMTGGLGDDTYVVDAFVSASPALSDKVVEAANGGTDTVISYKTYVLAANVENLILANTAGNIDGMGNALNNEIRGNIGANTLDGGAGDDKLFGFGGNDTLKGGAGNDFLDGGTGNDILQGGAGDDTYLVDQEIEQGNASEALNAGTDTVRSTVKWTLGTNFENLVLLGSAGLEGTGNALNNRIIGTDGADVLKGMAGDDFLDGGAGLDTMEGGAGNDTYVQDELMDQFVELENGGIDTVQLLTSRGEYDVASDTGVVWSLMINFENVVMLGEGDLQARGNDLSNTITGNSGNNVLDGRGLGIDKLIGGKGNDVYFLDQATDAITELANEGVDTVFVEFAPAGGTYTLGANLEVLRLSHNTGIVNGTGNALDNGLEGNNKANKLDGGAGNDFIHGGGGGDTLIGGAGNDMMEANGGNSTAGTRATMTGGLGDDWYVIGSLDSGDHKGERDANIVELAGQGTDTVQTAVDFDMSDVATGAANIENLYLDHGGYHDYDPGFVEDDWNIHGVGNALDNRIFGNLGNNIVEGGGGNDTFYFHTYSVDYSTWSAITGDPGTHRFFGASLDGNDHVYGGISTGGPDGTDSGTDTLYAAVNDVSDPADGFNQLHIHGVEDITLYSGSYLGAVNNIDASDIRGAERITFSDMRYEDSVDDFGVSNGGSNAEMTVSNLASGVEVRLDGFSNLFAVTLAGNTSSDLLNITLSHFFSGIYMQEIETVHLKVDQPADGSDVGAFLNADDIEHIILSGRAGQIYLGMPQSDADITLDDANLNVFISGNGSGALEVNLNKSGAGLWVADAISSLNLNTSGGAGNGGASSLSVVNVNTSLVNLSGDQELSILFNQNLDASTMTGNLSANSDVSAYGVNITGGLGSDQLNGSAGGDRLNGGDGGNDFLFGGAGTDVFVFDTAPGDPSHNVYIVDFQSGSDRIELADFFGAPTEPVGTGDFFTGDPANSTNQHFIFDQASGGLYYDADGNGATSNAQLIATFLNGHTIQAGDITVV